MAKSNLCWPLVLYAVIWAFGMSGIMMGNASLDLKFALFLLMALKAFPWVFTLYWLCKMGRSKAAWLFILLNFVALFLVSGIVIANIDGNKQTENYDSNSANYSSMGIKMIPNVPGMASPFMINSPPQISPWN